MKWLLRKAAAGLLLASFAVVLWGPGTAQSAPPLEPSGSLNPEIHKIVSSKYHTAAIRSDGTVWTWGNSDAYLGYSYDGSLPRQVELPGGLEAVDIAAGLYHTVAAASNGTVWAWGYPEYIGTDENTAFVKPYRVKTGPDTYLEDIVAVSAGTTHSLALDGLGNVWSWGENGSGELGTGSISASPYARQVLTAEGPLGGVMDIAAGAEFSVALGHNGSVYTWGSNLYGQLGRSPSSTDYALAMPVPGLSGISRIHAGTVSMSVLAEVGSVTDMVYGWGNNASGQLGIPAGSDVFSPVAVSLPANTGILAVSMGEYHSTALLKGADQTVRFYGTGSNDSGQLGCDWNVAGCLSQWAGFTLNPDLTGVAGLSGGSDRTFLLKEDGKVYGFGENWYDQLGTGGNSGNVYGPSDAVLPLSYDGRGSLSGVVKDLNTGLALEGAVISAATDGYHDGLSAVTDAGGRYELRGLSPEIHRITIEAAGYEDRGGSFLGGHVLDVRHVQSRDWYLTEASAPEISFSDADPAGGMVSGYLNFYDPSVTEAVYDVWLVTPAGIRVENGMLGAVSQSGSGLSISRAIPAAATGIRLFQGETPTGAWLPFIDNAMNSAMGKFIRSADLSADPELIQPYLQWTPAANENAVAAYRIFGFYYEGGGEYLTPGDPSIIDRLLYPATAGFSEGSYYTYGEIGEVAKNATGGYAYTGPVLQPDQYAVLFVIPVDAYGRYDHLGNAHWHLATTPNNTAGSLELPEVSLSDYLTSPVNVEFIDTDPSGTFGGTVTWSRDSGEYSSNRYSIYAVGANNEKLKWLGNTFYMFDNEHYFDLPAGTELPPGTVGISVVSTMYWEESAVGSGNTAPLLHLDAALPAPGNLSFTDTHAAQGVVTGTAAWSMESGSASVAGYGLMALDYWKLPLARLGSVPTVTQNVYSLTEVELPTGTRYLGVASLSETGRSGLATVQLNDLNGVPRTDYIDFSDFDWDQDQIGGSVGWFVNDAAAAAEYSVYFLDEALQPIGSALATGTAANASLEVPFDTPVLPEAVYIAVAAVSGESKDVLIHKVLTDNYSVFEFMDMDVDAGQIGGSVLWYHPEAKEEGKYGVFFLDVEYLPIGSALAEVTTPGAALVIPEHTAVPPEARYLGIAAVQGTEVQLLLSRDNFDFQHYEEAYMEWTDMDLTAYELEGWVYWNVPGTPEAADGFGLYFLDGGMEPVGPPLGVQLVAEEYFQIPPDTVIPVQARYLGVAALNGTAKELLVHVPIDDWKGLLFVDTDLNPDKIGGIAEWDAVETPPQTDGYGLYFTDENLVPIGSGLDYAPGVGESMEIPAGTNIPAGAAHLAIAVINGTEIGVFAHTPLVDLRLTPAPVSNRISVDQLTALLDGGQLTGHDILRTILNYVGPRTEGLARAPLFH